MIRKFLGATFFTILILGFTQLNAQTFNHWMRNFNEESSLLAGAVVGGGSGPSAIYYNPASISEIKESKLSFHASLFSFNFFKVKEALGDGIDLSRTIIGIEPRFISYMIKPKKHSKWNLEIALLNNQKYKVDFIQSVDKRVDVLTHVPGDERYFAMFQYTNSYRDDWAGIGCSWILSNRLSFGVSMFVTIKSMEYTNIMTAEAYPIDSNSQVLSGNEYYSASALTSDYVKYNDYRLLWKLGLLYKTERYSFGLCFTTPSIGGIYSDGKRVAREQKQTNIHDPETGVPIPDYVITDYQEKSNVMVNHKSSLSIAAGFTWHSINKTKSLYTTVEYFGGLDPYRLIQANESPDLSSGNISGTIAANEWLTFVSGATPVINGAIGYSWLIKDDLNLMTGFRTDFNYVKDFDYSPYVETSVLKGLYANYYHISGGLSYTVKGMEFITGLQYTIASEKNQKQIANVSDPVEFNYNEMAPLQGDRQNTMSMFVNAVSLYLGASFNFGGSTD